MFIATWPVVSVWPVALHDTHLFVCSDDNLTFQDGNRYQPQFGQFYSVMIAILMCVDAKKTSRTTLEMRVSLCVLGSQD